MTITAPPHSGTTGGGQVPPQPIRLTRKEFWWEFWWGLIWVGFFTNLLKCASSTDRSIAVRKLGANLAGFAVIPILALACIGALAISGGPTTGTPAPAPSYRITMDPSQGPVAVQVTPAPAESPSHAAATLPPVQANASPRQIVARLVQVRWAAACAGDVAALDQFWATHTANTADADLPSYANDATQLGRGAACHKANDPKDLRIASVSGPEYNHIDAIVEFADDSGHVYIRYQWNLFHMNGQWKVAAFM